MYPIARYLSTRLVYSPAFFADGQRIAFVTDISGVPQVWQTGLPAAGQPPVWPEQLTFGADRVQGVVCSPVPGDNRLIYTRDVGGNEKAQLFLLDVENGTETALTAGHENAMHIPGDWSADGRFISFAATRRNPGLFDTYVMDLESGETRMVWQHEEPGYVSDLKFAPDGSHMAAVRITSSTSCDLFEIDLETATARALTDDGEPVYYMLPTYTADGRGLLLITDRDADFKYIARLDLASGAIERIVAADWDIERMLVAPGGRYLAYTVNVGGLSELYVYDLESGQTVQAPAIDDAPGIVWNYYGINVAFAPDTSKLVFCYSSAVRATAIYTWDLATHAIQPASRAEHGGLPQESFIAPELVHYPTFDQDAQGETRHIPAWYFRPPGASSENPAPVLVYVHGGPESQIRPSFMGLFQYLLHNGFAVLAPNVRGSSGYGKTYSHMDDVHKRMDSVADLAHAAYWLQQQPEIDGERLIVYGGSYGGFMVLSAMTTYPDLWVAGVDIVGISSFVTFLENTSAYRRAHREAEYGSLAEDREFLESISPFNHIDQITAPLMVVHGANDPRVPLGEAEQVVAALEQRGVPVRLMVFDDEGHGIVKLKNKLAVYPAIVDFLQEHLA